MAPQQSEFQMRVAVCAWCKTKNRGVDLGPSLGSISHGICLRHMKQLMLDLERRKDPNHPATPPRPRRRHTTSSHPELNYDA